MERAEDPTINLKDWRGCKGMFREAQKYLRNPSHPPDAPFPFGQHPQPTKLKTMSKNNSKPYKKLTGRPPKDAEDKRSKKVSATFTEAEYTEIKYKAAAAGLTISELLRVSAFRLTIVERLTEFEREAIREFMHQGKNLNLLTRAALAHGWMSIKQKIENYFAALVPIIEKLKLKNDSLL